MSKTAEEQFLRNKIRENYSVSENFYLQHFDYLNAEKVLHWLTDFSSSKDARIKELEEQVKFYEAEIPVNIEIRNRIKELEARIETAEREELPENISEFIYELHRMRGLYQNKKFSLAGELRDKLSNDLYDLMTS